MLATPRMMRQAHSNTIALLFFEDPTPDDSLINPFFLSMLGSITRACAQRGYDVRAAKVAQHSELADDIAACRSSDRASAIPRAFRECIGRSGQ